jgi:hypothetical protein
MEFFEEEPECDYDMFRDLTEGVPPEEEHPLDIALRTNDPSLRCYYWEHGDANDWGMLTKEVQESYNRPPEIPELKVPSGSFYVYGTGTSLQVVTEAHAREHWMHSFQSQ